MARSVLLLTAGAIAGAAAAYVFVDLEAEPSASPPASPVEPLSIIDVRMPPSVEPDDSSFAETGSVTAARVAVYEQVVETTDALDLEFMIDRAAAAPRSRSRDLELTALLGRLAELDPERAVRFAQSSFLETRFLVQVFEALARADWDASAAALAGVTPPGKQRDIAIGLLDVIGNDARGVERIAVALPAEERANFEIDALLARANLDPVGVLQEVIARDQIVIQSYLLPRLAEKAVQLDPTGALALGELISDYDMRRSYQNAVFRAWADADPGSVFAYLAVSDPTELAMTTGAFDALAGADADRLLAMLDDFPPSVRTNARRAVIQSIAIENPVAAAAMLDTMPPGQDRESMLQVISQAYGRQNPDLALAWAKTLSPPSELAINSVLQGVAAVDTNRAIDLFIDELEQREPTGVAQSFSIQTSISFSMMLSLLSANNADVGRLADRLLEIDDPSVSSSLSSAVSMWTMRDRESALAWTLANADRLDANLLRNVSRNVASEDPDLAIATLDRLTPEQRAGWVDGLVSGMARNDVNQAVVFLERLRGQPEYESAYGNVATEMARVDPQAAARMLSNAPSSSALRAAAFTIAREWASREPRAAAQWALSLEDEQIQTSALNNVASTWAERDAESVEQWLYTLNSGPNRDAATDGLMTASAQAGQFRQNLLEAYSSEQASQQGASRAIVQIARNDPDGAKELLDLYITDPAIRSQTEEQLSRAAGVGRGVLISNGNVIFVQ